MEGLIDDEAWCLDLPEMFGARDHSLMGQAQAKGWLTSRPITSETSVACTWPAGWLSFMVGMLLRWDPIVHMLKHIGPKENARIILMDPNQKHLVRAWPIGMVSSRSWSLFCITNRLWRASAGLCELMKSHWICLTMGNCQPRHLGDLMLPYARLFKGSAYASLLWASPTTVTLERPSTIPAHEIFVAWGARGIFGVAIMIRSASGAAPSADFRTPIRPPGTVDLSKEERQVY